MRKFVLVRPEGPRNVGMVLRTATNFGSINVVLVDPRRPSMLKHPDFEQMSHGVADGLTNRRRFEVVGVCCTDSPELLRRLWRLWSRNHRLPRSTAGELLEPL